MPVLLSNETDRPTSSASSISTRSGRNRRILAAGFGLFVVVAVAALVNGGTERSGADEAEALRAPSGETREPSITTLPAESPAEDREDVDDLGAIEDDAVPFDLVESVSDGSVGTEQNADYVAMTADGLTPLEAVGEEINYSLVVGTTRSPTFVDPNTGMATELPDAAPGVLYLSETHVVLGSSRSGDAALARPIWESDDQSVLLAANTSVVVDSAGPTPDQVWLINGRSDQRHLINLDSGEVLASADLSAFEFRLSHSPTEVFVPRGGGIYERAGATVSKISDEFGLAASEGLFLVLRCDEIATCSTAWVSRETGQTLEYPPLNNGAHSAMIDPTGTWVFVADFLANEFVVWEIATGRRMFETNPFADRSAFSPDGRWLMLDDDGFGVEVIHVATGTKFTIEVQTPQSPQSRRSGAAVFFPLGYAFGR